MWAAQSVTLTGHQRFLLKQQGAPLSNREFFRLLASSAEFADWYNALLADVAAECFFWEFPPLSTASIDNPVEFVTIASPMLRELRPDPESFRVQFAAARGFSTVAFPNLGGDALLIAPVPQSAPDTYTHLANFVRNASSQQACDLWAQTGKQVRQSLSEKPVWLNTSGLGIGWLHIRLDSRPKYYQYQPYKYSSASSISLPPTELI